MKTDSRGESELAAAGRKSEEVLIVGSGIMGAGLAQAFAQNEIAVGLVGRSEVSLERAFGLIERSLEEGVAKGVFTASTASQIKGRIQGMTIEEIEKRIDGVKLVIESITEDFAAKKDLLRRLDPLFSPPVVFASNTSSLDAEALARMTAHPERVIWAHFFYPPQKNRTVEVSPLSITSPAAMDVALDLFHRARRQVVTLRSYRRGGAANIIFVALMLEAIRMIDEGYNGSLVDEASRLAFGSSLGLVSLLQLVGPETALTCALSFSKMFSPSDPLFLVYDNFFTPPRKLKEVIRNQGKEGLLSFLKSTPESVASSRDQSLDPLVLELFRQRFLAVAFMTASEVVQSGLIDPASCDRLCQLAFGWPDGPFTLMNRMGIESSLRLVTERMELSHRLEINFPVPRNLIEHAQKNEPWPLK